MSKSDDTCDNNPANSNKKIPLLTEKFVVRFPPLMRHEIHVVANRCKRSMNKEILARLEHSLLNFPTVPSAFSESGAKQNLEKQSQLLDHASPEAEVMLNFKLKEMLGKLGFNQKVCLLRLLQSVESLGTTESI